MKTPLALAAVLSVLIISSCNKNDPAPPDPAPAAKPDTLLTGWKKVIVNAGEIFSDVFFLADNNTGYLAGTNHLYKTTDGGVTWNPVLKKLCSSLAVTPDGKVFMVNTSDTIFKSTDGGATFSGYKIAGSPAADIFFINNTTGYCVTYNGLYATADAGLTWTKAVTSGINFTPTYSSLFFKNSTTGWIVNGGNAYKTNGSVNNWSGVTFTGTGIAAPYYSVFATAGNNVYIASTITGVYKSTDGTTFSLLSALKAANTNLDIHFVNDDAGYVSGAGRIYKTTDGGQTWTVAAALGEAYLIELHFTDATHGWACGSNGTVLCFKL